MTPPIRIGILGAAKIAPRAVIETARTRPQVEISCVAARDPDHARAFAEVHAIPDIAASYEALVNRDDVDLVYVALPAGLHAQWSIRALQAGKAVLCEKPFALDEAQARAMVEAAAIAGRPLLEAFHYIHHPVMTRALQLVEEGAIGRLVWAEGVFAVPIAYSPDELRWRPELGGGALMDLGCYAVHALRRATGDEPVVRSASAVMRHGVDAAMEARLWFPSAGVSAAISCSMVSAGLDARLTLTGAEGRIDITNFMAPQIGCRFGLECGERRETLLVDPTPTFAFQLDHLIDVMQGQAQPRVGGTDSIATMRAIDAIKAKASEASG
jgi:predicted dehydrogenase